MGVKVEVDGALIFFVNNECYPTGIETPTYKPLYVVVSLHSRVRQITILESPRAQRKQSVFRHRLMYGLHCQVADFERTW